MPYYLNPFAKHDVSHFPGVLMTLEEAQAYHASGERPESDIKDSKATEAGMESIGDYVPYSIEGLRAEIDNDISTTGYDTSYDRKSKLINKAIQDIGMGRYQYELFCLCGFGWAADNLWLQGVALCLPQLSADFGINSNTVRYTTCALFVGLCIGASFWGIASDIVGRRLAFNFTLFIAGVFGVAAGAAPDWIAACGLFSAMGFGVGGNLPVDGALFLEFLPFASANLLMLLSVWWPVGQLVASLVAWGFIPNYPTNEGWRYFVYTMGALTLAMFICRFFFFHLFESPKFLLARGRQAEAVAVIHGLAYKNKTKTWLTEEILNEICGTPDNAQQETRLSNTEIFRRFFARFSKDRISPLFSNWRVGVTTALIWVCWATIGMGYPLFNSFLPQYFARVGKTGQTQTTYEVYRNYAIESVVGVPGSVIGAYTVDIPYVGRKGTMALSTLISAIFLFLFTISADAKYQLAFSCVESFFQNIMYGVLYAYTPEVFPAPNRGTGTGIASFLNRITGLCAPLVAINAGKANPNGPVYASGSLILAAFVAMCLLPIETRGKMSL
ncbi:MFS general substrate transporter [Gloeophyllum trabeum ATCC 11539]|uniref:MFS general substrate transporter n=1 Tax=Gloeophyllum trabeum (strain ATCC 11539 / FP-39264 / Madison 617) TaxID=670483 RepID=S7RTL7_GLOTA|nr:MFS general substrate transporter [Gloeophyllum trabeum ATCC 11539]EPQ58015.1 MFS general substrate transporter [Gloeophyllum trabeum ATCC 11539]